MAGSGQGSPGTGVQTPASLQGQPGGVRGLHPEIRQVRIVGILAQGVLQVGRGPAAEPAHAARLAHLESAQVVGHRRGLALPAGQAHEALERVGHAGVELIGLVLALGARAQADAGFGEARPRLGVGVPGRDPHLAGPVQAGQAHPQLLEGLVHRLQAGLALVRMGAQELLPGLPARHGAAGVDGVQHLLAPGPAGTAGGLLPVRSQQHPVRLPAPAPLGPEVLGHRGAQLLQGAVAPGEQLPEGGVEVGLHGGEIALAHAEDPPAGARVGAAPALDEVAPGRGAEEAGQEQDEKEGTQSH